MVVVTVYHDGQFWAGVAERNDDGVLKAVRTVFGCEPTEQDVIAFAHLAICETLDAAKESVEAPKLPVSSMNPKRRQREIRREIASAQGASTKAQAALQREREARGVERKKTAKLRREETKERKRLQKQAKKKKKHRGR
ncbi:MAG: YjdF family protein [Synergistaceae bacterium]|nr:YjdF family protein [Synergistota bacterium]NLM71818.1 YjdF family protein [Synergistaceae bacterium]